MNAMDLRRGVNLAVDTAVVHLKPRARMISITEVVAQTGGAGEVEVSGKKDRVTSALNAAKAAVVEGILSIAVAPQICVQMPAYTISQYAGVEGAVVVGKLLEQQSLEIGYDEAKGEYLNMVKAGIIHPVEVIRTVLTGAESIFLLLRTTDAVITELPKNDAPAFPPGGIGGTGGMSGIDQ